MLNDERELQQKWNVNKDCLRSSTQETLIYRSTCSVMGDTISICMAKIKVQYRLWWVTQWNNCIWIYLAMLDIFFNSNWIMKSFGWRTTVADFGLLNGVLLIIRNTKFLLFFFILINYINRLTLFLWQKLNRLKKWSKNSNSTRI